MTLDPQDGTADYDVNPNWAQENADVLYEEDWEGSLDSMEASGDPILQQLEIATGVLGNIFSSIKLQYRVVDMDLDQFTGTGKTSPTYDTCELAEEMQKARGGCIEVRYVTEWQDIEQ